MAIKNSYRVDPGRILATGMDDIIDKYQFRAIVMIAVNAASKHVDDKDIEAELRSLYSTLTDD